MNNKGFTMVEMMISLVILAFAIVGLCVHDGSPGAGGGGGREQGVGAAGGGGPDREGSPPPRLPTAGLRLFRVRRRRSMAFPTTLGPRV